MQALAQALPNARLRALERQTHVVKPKVHAPLLEEFFTSGDHVQDVRPATVRRVV